MAAIAAARAGADVFLLEKTPRVGRKLLLTGNGRCNLTHSDCSPRRYHGRRPEFFRTVLTSFPAERTLSFFKELGLLTKTEEDGRVFPLCDQASTVLDLLRDELSRLNVPIHAETEIRNIRNRFDLTCADNRRFKADRVILSTGGLAHPETGSDGKGLLLAEQCGHHLVPVFPVLVPVRVRSPFLKSLKGTRTDCDIELTVDGKPVQRESGEIIFNSDNLSGIPLFQLSRKVTECLQAHRRPSLRIDLLPGINAKVLAEELEGRFRTRPQEPPERALLGLLNKRFIPVLLKTAGFKTESPSGSTVSRSRVSSLVELIKGWSWEITGTLGWAEAQATAGGVDTLEVDPLTMESRLTPGLFFAGEILDVDGDCGGFNLHWAWATGATAGRAAAGTED